MEKLQNYTLQKFLDSFVQELKRENEDRIYRNKKELDIPFIISSLYQSFKNSPDNCGEFIKDLERYPDCNIVIENAKNDYDGIIDVSVSLIRYEANPDSDFDYDNYNYADHSYLFEFSYDERMWGSCECTPDMKDYREDKHCCGHGCDASFCKFQLHKVLDIVSDTWHGDEHDYWNFEDEFYASDKELANKKAEEDKARMIKELKSRIEADSKKLAGLEDDK